METINNPEYKARRVLILGTTGTGKTTLACRLVETHPAPLVLVYDWQGGEFGNRLGAKICEDRDELKAAIADGDRIICYNAEKGEADPEGEGFEWFCEMFFELAGQTPGRKVLVIDECQDLIDPWNIPVPLKKILTRGRRREADTVLIGSAPNALHSVGRNQVSELYCFRLVDENALKFTNSLGIDSDKVRGLADCEFIAYDGRTGNQIELDLWKKKTRAHDQPVS